MVQVVKFFGPPYFDLAYSLQLWHSQRDVPSLSFLRNWICKTQEIYKVFVIFIIS